MLVITDKIQDQDQDQGLVILTIDNTEKKWEGTNPKAEVNHTDALKIRTRQSTEQDIIQIIVQDLSRIRTSLINTQLTMKETGGMDMTKDSLMQVQYG